VGDILGVGHGGGLLSGDELKAPVRRIRLTNDKYNRILSHLRFTISTTGHGRHLSGGARGALYTGQVVERKATLTSRSDTAPYAQKGS